MTARIVESAVADHRIACARDWLISCGAREQVLVIAATGDAANELVRTAALRKGAAFGWHRMTLGRLTAALATPAVAERGVTPIGALAAEAVVARVVHELRAAGTRSASADTNALGRYAPVGDSPGFARALSRTLAELRLAGATPDLLSGQTPELARLCDAFERELERAGLADRANMLGLAAAAARDAKTPAPAGLILGLPTLLLDVPLRSAAEARLVAALASRAPDLLATVAAGDARSLAWLSQSLAPALPESLEVLRPSEAFDASEVLQPLGSLARLQRGLFSGENMRVAASEPSEGLTVLSAPGESRECVEIARRVAACAADGVPFDEMAVLLRSPDEYRPHLQEAFRRADIPAHFARGVVQPDPAGRAFLALLACAAEGLSARRFAEYLSLGQLPDATKQGAPPLAAAPEERWVAPDDEFVSERVARALEPRRSLVAPPDGPDPGFATSESADGPVAHGTLRAPRRWERLLVEAAVIGGRDRWERRLAGLEHELALQIRERVREEGDADDATVERLRATLEDLAALRAYALPLLEVLDGFARISAESTGQNSDPTGWSWGRWLDELAAVATSSLRHPERVLGVLAEFAPMSPIGPVSLAEVRGVLASRLLEVSLSPPASRYGGVFVAPVEAARGLAFEVVFVPGLAERLFPRKISEEPILLDDARAALIEACQLPLATNADRVADERLALRLAVGAARPSGHLVISYPRLDLDQGRPRVPSFYALEAVRAVEGELPGFDALARRAESLGATRVGWPAPDTPEDAIDEAEHDLALLDSLLRLDPERSIGTARYLVTANPHLGRALRFRARRWLTGWTVADGLVKPSEAGAQALAAHALNERSYSPTALQHFAACPYRFLLQAVHRLSPREEPEAIEQMNPLQRGSLVHDVLFELQTELNERELLPVRPGNVSVIRSLLDETLERVAARYRDELAPAIARVWDDGVESVRADLREWLRRASEDESGFVPWRFELAFGLPPAGDRRDPHSTASPVQLDSGLQLRGSADLVERGPTGSLRVTDYKTGRVRVKQGSVIEGGLSLQPVFYALALEKLLGCEGQRQQVESRAGSGVGSGVESGRLYYCTAMGDYAEREVPLDDEARRSARVVAETVGGAIRDGFLPAAPAKDACRWCDYNVVCGPYEEMRSGRKSQHELQSLSRLRALR